MPDLVPLPTGEVERQFQAGEIKAIATLASDAAAAQAPEPVPKVRLESYVVGQQRQPPS